MRMKGVERQISATMNAGRRRSENGGGTRPLPLILLIFLLFLTLLPLLCPTGAFAWRIPDTGQTKCYNNTTELTCPKPGDAFYGQDGSYNINSISYAKSDADSLVFSDAATAPATIRGNAKALIGEYKTGGASIHHKAYADNQAGRSSPVKEGVS